MLIARFQRGFRRWKRWVKVAAPRIGISRLSRGMLSGMAIRVPASQTGAICLRQLKYPNP